MSAGCYKTSCWCAPIRCLSSCFTCCRKKKNQRPSQYVVNTVSVAVLGTSSQTHSPATHHRERTWKLSNGRMSYEKDQT